MGIHMKCKNCVHHDTTTWICSNPDSSYVADFTDEDDWCSEYEGRDDGEEDY